MALHGLQALGQRAGEVLVIAKAHHQRDDRDALDAVGQGVPLLVGDDLDAVLDIAQEQIGLGQLLSREILDPTGPGQPLQGAQRLPPAQALVAPADDELLRLREKLDFADAAAAKFNIVAANLDLAMPLVPWICRLIE